MNLVNFEVERPFNRVEVRLNGNDNDCFFIDCICVIIYKIRKKERKKEYFLSGEVRTDGESEPDFSLRS